VSCTLVIGIGNSLRGDDGAGPAVVDAVARRASHVRTRIVQQLVPELADDVSRADVVVFVDASTAVAGVVVRPLAPGTATAHTHVADPAGILALCRSAFGVLPGAAWQVEVPASRFELGEGLSAAAQAGVDDAVDRVVELVKAIG
jgi:hydrogenase maturation protease